MNERDYITQNEQKGNINISEDVIATIATAAAKEVDGVAGLSTVFSGEIVERLGKKSAGKGIKLVRTEEGIYAGVSVLVKYGQPVREVAARLQTAVADAISGMTGLPVKEVDVNIAGVAFDK